MMSWMQMSDEFIAWIIDQTYHDQEFVEVNECDDMSALLTAGFEL